MITRNFNLYLNAGHSVPLVINVNQYDSGEQWVFTLYNSDGTQYTPSTGAIVGIKSDGLGIINSGSVVDGKVVINETQQMTAAVGKAVFELLIDSQTHGTANFVVLVEEKPGNNADLSESDLSLLQEAIDATSPLPTGGSVGQVLTKTANGSTWSDAGTPTQEQVADAVSDWADEHITVTTGVVIDTSLSVAGAAADSKKVGDEITDLKSAISGGGMSAEFKAALMAIFDHIGGLFTDANGRTYIENLRTALYPPASLTSITAVYTQSGEVNDTDSLNSLKADLVVTAHYDDSTSEVLSDSDYTLSGTLTEGTSTITVMYGGKSTTFTVVVTAVPVPPIAPNTTINVSEKTLTSGMISDSGEVVASNNSYFIDELYDAEQAIYFKNDAMVTFSSSLAGRSAYYDSSNAFLSRKYVTTGKVITPATGAAKQKLGWTSASNPDYLVVMTLIDNSIFTNPNTSLNASGEAVSTTGLETTDFLEIGNLTNYLLKQPPGTSSTARLCFYDSSKALLQRYAVNQSNQMAFGAIPEGTAYYRYDHPAGVQAYSPFVGF